MKKVLRVVVIVLAAGLVSLCMAGCQKNKKSVEAPKVEHPKGEHPKGEHPAATAPKAEHPKGEHPSPEPPK